MPKPRSADSMLTKIENMEVGEEIYTFKSNGYISDNLNTIKRKFPTRKYSQISVYTHEGSELPKSVKDFIKVIYITRFSLIFI